LTLQIDLSGFGNATLIEAQTLRHDDLNAVNSADDSTNVAPAPLAGVTVTAGRIDATLPAASWTLVRLRSLDHG
jgi:alpha-L-arabinofuranosidase